MTCSTWSIAQEDDHYYIMQNFIRYARVESKDLGQEACHALNYADADGMFDEPRLPDDEQLMGRFGMIKTAGKD